MAASIPLQRQSTDQPIVADPPRRRGRWIAGAAVAAVLVVVLVVVAVVLPAQRRQERIDRLTAQAAADATALLEAATAAREAVTAGTESDAAAQRYLDEVVLGATDAVMSVEALAAPEAVAALVAQVEAFSASRGTPPVAGGTELEPPFQAPDLAEVLAERYIEGDDDDLAAAEAARDAEIARLDALRTAAAEQEAARVTVITQYEAALTAAVASLPAGTPAVEAEAPRSAPEHVEALRAASAALTEPVVLSASDESGGAVPAMLDAALEQLPTIVERVGAVRSAAEAVRASHAEVVAAEEAAAAAAAAEAAAAERRRGSGSGSGSGSRQGCRVVVMPGFGGDSMSLGMRCD